MKLAVLITSYNRKNTTLICLDKLFASKFSDALILDVFLVDDGSTDGTELAVKTNYKSVKIIKGDGNLYWGGGTNKAWIQAIIEYDYDYYLWLNDDVEIFDYTIDNLIKHSKKVKNTAIICASMQDKESLKITYGGGLKGIKGLLLPSGLIQKCETINGNCVLIPNYVYKKVGMIDSVFIHAMGDLDYGMRALKLGIDCFILPDFGGYCDLNKKIPRWNQASLSFNDRLLSLYSISSYKNPYKYFIFSRRHFGLITAILHILKMHLKLFFPNQ